MGIGDWGLGIGDWGLGIGDWAQSPIPNPQSPLKLKKLNILYDKFKFKYYILYYKILIYSIIYFFGCL